MVFLSLFSISPFPPHPSHPCFLPLPHKLPITPCSSGVTTGIRLFSYCLTCLCWHLRVPVLALTQVLYAQAEVLRNPSQWDSNNRRTGDKIMKAAPIWCPIRKPTKSDRRGPLSLQVEKGWAFREGKSSSENTMIWSVIGQHHTADKNPLPRSLIPG